MMETYLISFKKNGQSQVTVKIILLEHDAALIMAQLFDTI